MARYRLGSICQIISGSTPKTGVQEYWNGDKKWITPAELSESDYIIYDTERKLTEAGVRSAGLTPLPKGTVILSSRAPIGKVAIAGCEMYCNQGFKNFVCSNIINNKYLYWYLRSKTDFLNSLGRGATFKEISKSTVADIELDIPELSEQSKRVAHLEKLQSIIASRRVQFAKLDELVKCRFVELFCRNHNTHNDNLIASLDELLKKNIITYHLDGNHGSDYPRSHEFIEAGGITYISANCILNGHIDYYSAKHLSNERAYKLRKGIAKNGDVLFAHNATVGPVAILETEEERIILGTSLTAYRCNFDYVLPQYLKAYMESEYFVSQYANEMKQTTRNQVPITAQRKYTFIIPPIDLQTTFATFVRRIDKLRKLGEERLKMGDKRRNWVSKH